MRFGRRRRGEVVQGEVCGRVNAKIALEFVSKIKYDITLNSEVITEHNS
jgi:hypothetical protein